MYFQVSEINSEGQARHARNAADMAHSKTSENLGGVPCLF
jgi:hypothetical protein